MEACWRYGQCLELAGRHEEALQAYNDLLSDHPDHEPARQRRDLLVSVLRRPVRSAVPSQARAWNTHLPKEAMMQIQLATHAYTYRGVPLIKNPFDFALYPLLLWNARPRTIIEIGSKSGASALWLADLVETYGLEGHVYSLDIVRVTNVNHSRVSFLEADGRQLGDFLSAEFLNQAARPLLVIEDADHTYETSAATLRFFSPWLQTGEYIIIEDGILSDILSLPGGLCGPHRAIEEFLAEHSGEYEIASEYCDFFGYNYTWCTNGYLRKVR
jgi:cephalosporin hydroxylase